MWCSFASETRFWQFIHPYYNVHRRTVLKKNFHIDFICIVELLKTRTKYSFFWLTSWGRFGRRLFLSTSGCARSWVALAEAPMLDRHELFLYAQKSLLGLYTRTVILVCAPCSEMSCDYRRHTCVGLLLILHDVAWQGATRKSLLQCQQLLKEFQSRVQFIEANV
jgi:hypothetical protein